MMTWTDERVESLKQLWSDGLSASQIANRLGGITRNAVIGKVHRLGLSGRGSPSRASRPRTRKLRQPGPETGKVTQFPTAGATALKPQAQAEAAPKPRPAPKPVPLSEVAPSGARCDILALNERTCRWPIGEPGTEEFCFCGDMPKTGVPYCEHHARIAYQPLHDRRRTKRAAGGRGAA